MKRQAIWNDLREKMSGKRTRNDAMTGRKNKKSSAPHEIIVQRLASEPDSKQTFKPVQPWEFLNFEHEELSLWNLKKACATHFNLPPSTCDVLVSNKGPSCSNISQIPHRKDKVYVVRVVVQEEENGNQASAVPNHAESRILFSFEKSFNGVKLPAARACKSTSSMSATTSGTAFLETAYPASVSIDALLKSGKLVKPQPKNKVTLTFENFDVKTQAWKEVMEEEVLVHTQKFSSGAFRDAFHATTSKEAGKNQQLTQWVVKTYNSKAVKTIEETLGSSVESHCRKLVQMHGVARYLAKYFELKVPSEFGKCFQYNPCFYTTYNGQPATVEEYVPGSFVKIINNDGQCVKPPEGANCECKQLFAKAQCLVHYTFYASDKKLMLLDIQGSNYKLHDPEIATDDAMDAETNELYFCCGNCTSVGMETFLKAHICNEFCKMMGLSDE